MQIKIEDAPRLSATITIGDVITCHYVVGAVWEVDGTGWTVWRMGLKDRSTMARRITTARATPDEAAADLAAVLDRSSQDSAGSIRARLYARFNTNQLPPDLAHLQGLLAR